MKNKVISLLIVIAMISLAGCGSKGTTVEPTETVIETEEKVVETETETEEPTEEVAVIETETEEPSPFSNIKDENGEYTEELIGTLAMYPFFEGKTESEIREYLASDDDLQCYLRDGKVADIEFYLESLYDFYGNDKSGSTNASSSDTNNSSTSNKGNSSSTSNNTGNTAGSQSNTNSSTAGSNSSTPAEQPPAPSNSESQDVINNGDGTITAPGGIIYEDGSNFGNGPSTNYGNAIY